MATPKNSWRVLFMDNAQPFRPFTTVKLEEDRGNERSIVISIRLNREEILKIEDAGRLLNQQMQSTIVKQLVDLGLICLQTPETRASLRMAAENTRRNLQRGIMEAQPKIGGIVGAHNAEM